MTTETRKVDPSKLPPTNDVYDHIEALFERNPKYTVTPGDKRERTERCIDGYRDTEFDFSIHFGAGAKQGTMCFTYHKRIKGISLDSELIYLNEFSMDNGRRYVLSDPDSNASGIPLMFHPIAKRLIHIARLYINAGDGVPELFDDMDSITEEEQ